MNSNTPFQLEMVDLRPTPAFEAWKSNRNSQCGEDGILEHLLRALDVTSGYFVEFGAWDGRHLSNCAALADRGFAGCFIEGDESRHRDLLAAYPGRSDIARVHAFVYAEGENSLDAILARAGAPKEPTVLSIDIDGMDYHVWSSLAEHRPSICIVEFNPTIPANVAFVQARDETVHQGCSLAALYQLGRRKGYSLVAATEFNGIFMRDELCEHHNVATYLPEEAKPRTYETVLFHGFDGTMMSAGNRKLLWHGAAFDDADLQILPEPLRRFPVGVPQAYFERLQEFLQRRSDSSQGV